MGNKELKSSDYLPEEIIGQILSRLPVKSVFQCTTVCKLWYALIKNPNFISAHFQRTTLFSSNNNHYFLCMFWDKICNFSLRFDDENFDEFMPLQTPFMAKDHIKIVGSCNGVICLIRDFYENRKFLRKFFLWNPLIRKIFQLPDSTLEIPRNYYENFMGFAFDSRTCDFKVLRIMSTSFASQSFFRAEIYSFNSNSWKDITHITPKYNYYDYYSGLLVNDSLYCIAFNWDNGMGKKLVVFNVCDELFHEIDFPKYLQKGYLISLQIGGKSSIAVVCQVRYHSEIWIMEAYGAESSWVKLATVGKQKRGRSTVLGFRRNGEVLMKIGCKDCHLASQKLNEQAVQSLVYLPKRKCSKAYNYIESLVLFDKGDDVHARDAGGTIKAKEHSAAKC